MEHLNELKELLAYLINHNDDHAKEIAELAGRAKDLESPEAYALLMEGVEFMKASNEKFKEGHALMK